MPTSWWRREAPSISAPGVARRYRIQRNPLLGKSVYDEPLRFLASQLLADSVDDVIIWDGAPGRAAVRLRALAERCPGVLVSSPKQERPVNGAFSIATGV